MPNSMPTPRL